MASKQTLKQLLALMSGWCLTVVDPTEALLFSLDQRNEERVERLIKGIANIAAIPFSCVESKSENVPSRPATCQMES